QVMRSVTAGPPPTIGHVNHVDAGHHLEQLVGQIGRCSGSSRRIIDFARASLGAPVATDRLAPKRSVRRPVARPRRVGDELGNRLGRDRWIYRMTNGVRIMLATGAISRMKL